MENIIQLKISLQGVRPVIWRRIQIDKNITLFDLHHVFQVTMGWCNCHRFEFRTYGYKIGLVDDALPKQKGIIDSNSVLLDTLIVEEGEKFEYIYDFGDTWQHVIEVEKFLPESDTIQYSICTEGENCCPPEDCGGSLGYQNILEVLKDKKHMEYKDTLRWVGKNFNSGYFIKDKVNFELSKLDEYIQNWKKDWHLLSTILRFRDLYGLG